MKEIMWEEKRETISEIMFYFEHYMPEFHYEEEDCRKLNEKFEDFVDALEKIVEQKYRNRKAILSEVQQLVEYINDFDETAQVMDSDQCEFICEFISECAENAGYVFEDDYEDITEEWRTF